MLLFQIIDYGYGRGVRYSVYILRLFGLFVFVCFGGVMTSTAQSKKLLLIVLRIVVRGGACELCILLTHIHRVIYQLVTCAHT